MFKQHGVKVVEGVHCTSISAAIDAYDQLQSKVVAVKSQIHAGGRGKGNLYSPESRDLVMEGGVKIAFSKQDVETYATNILGNVLVTKQTGDEGKVVNHLYVESGCDIAHEYYLALLVDREQKSVLVMASTEGGMDIEEVAEETPELLHKLNIDPNAGLLGYQIRDLGLALGLQGAAHKSFGKMLKALYSLFLMEDCAMVEINPLVRSSDDEMIALDAKVSFDENAEFRHKSWDDIRDLSEEEDVEIRAKETGLSYVKLDGNIGCLVNGAGLAMATMDIIKLYGKEPANFLDVGGGASKEKVSAALKIILSDKNVKGILINIFGGIMRCDVLAQGLVEAVKETKLSTPLVVRLAGTNVELGKEILKKSNLKIISANNLSDAAKKIIEVAK